MNRLLLLAVVLGSALVQTPAPSADDILGQIDRNAVAGNKVLVSEMTIHGRRDSRTLKFKSW
ncbi:MAG: outer membrane lipoprotein-sorting protein, partial [Candidatus Aminicenantes bacterium]|nr:outer membrane lipoprotein-sorting protein [Candidatus Aminicenantes bacterium]